MPLSLSPYTLLLQNLFFFSLISAFNSRDGLRRERETACRLLLSLQSLINDDGDAVDNVCVKIPMQFQSTYDIESKIALFYSKCNRIWNKDDNINTMIF